MTYRSRALNRKKVNTKAEIRKQRLRERFYRSNFFIFEIGFIFVIIPTIMITLVSVPVMLYFSIAQRFYIWPFIVTGSLIPFFQILAIKYYVKRFILDPHDMTLGEYLRYLVDKQILRKESLQDYNDNDPEWYDKIEDLNLRLRADWKEQTDKIYLNHYGSVVSSDLE